MKKKMGENDEMKKILLLLLAGSIAVVFASCAVSPDAGSGSTPEADGGIADGNPVVTTDGGNASSGDVPAGDESYYYTADPIVCSCGASLFTMVRHGSMGAPGAMPDYEYLPDADTSDVGKTLELKLDTDCGALGGVYRYNAANGKERLVIWSNHSRGNDVPRPVEVYETSFGGEKEFWRVAAEGEAFKAKLLGRMYFCMTIDGSYAPTAEHANGSYIIEKADDAVGGTIFVNVEHKDGKRVCTVSRPDGSGRGFEEFISLVFDRSDKRYGIKALISVED